MHRAYYVRVASSPRQQREVGWLPTHRCALIHHRDREDQKHRYRLRCSHQSIYLTSSTEGVPSGGVVARTGHSRRHRNAHDGAVELLQVLGPVVGVILRTAIPNAPVEVVVILLRVDGMVIDGDGEEVRHEVD